MLKSATSLLATLALVAASFTFGGCGGSSHQPGVTADAFGPGAGLVAGAGSLVPGRVDCRFLQRPAVGAGPVRVPLER